MSRVSSVKLKDTFIASFWYLNSNSICDLCNLIYNGAGVAAVCALPCEQQFLQLVEWLLGSPCCNAMRAAIPTACSMVTWSSSLEWSVFSAQMYKCFGCCTSSMPYDYWYELVVNTVSDARTPNTWSVWPWTVTPWPFEFRMSSTVDYSTFIISQYKSGSWYYILIPVGCPVLLFQSCQAEQFCKRTSVIRSPLQLQFVRNRR